ncbi:hypothetical protein SAMN05192565_1535 [Methylobacterium gossipiicola]|uniref:Uncharacterized protein n=1 Tax=Methylobacterium gossipiicola TaxID=582675 RepID=A0A1I2XMJ4_9HYPH|nr:hypothetical protein SAMN05192565_1535 [Methylobacterium gossipiicola]
MCGSGPCALGLVNGTNGARFRSSIANNLVPMLQPGAPVILDVPQAHKVASMREVFARLTLDQRRDGLTATGYEDDLAVATAAGTAIMSQVPFLSRPKSGYDRA